MRAFPNFVLTVLQRSPHAFAPAFGAALLASAVAAAPPMQGSTMKGSNEAPKQHESARKPAEITRQVPTRVPTRSPQTDARPTARQEAKPAATPPSRPEVRQEVKQPARPSVPQSAKPRGEQPPTDSRGVRPSTPQAAPAQPAPGRVPTATPTPAPRKPLEQPKNPPLVVPPQPRKPAELPQPETRRPTRDDKPIVNTPPAARPAPTQKPGSKPTPTPKPAATPTTARPNADRTNPVRDNTDLGARGTQRPTRDEPRPREQPSRTPAPQPEARPARFVSNTVHGVDVGGGRGGHENDRNNDRNRDQHNGRGDPDRHDGDDHGRYYDSVARCNGWSRGSRWVDCGPCGAWDRYDCNDGFSLAIGFGSGYSFGFFYGSSGAPLCTSWANPWWEGYASSWSCAPYSYSYAYSWRPWRHAWYDCGPCPISAWSPCYSYGPWYTPIYTPVYAPVVYTAVQPTLPNPDALWVFMADGYDRDAEDGFAVLEVAYPADARWPIGRAFARALRSDTVGAADIFRRAFAADPSAIRRVSIDPKFLTRLDGLERAVTPAATAATPSMDALLVLAATEAARGDINAAYLDATTAQAEGDRSIGTGQFVDWLRAELRRRP